MIKDNRLNYTLNVLARWAVGLVFLFSSFVKGVDPMGTTFKIQEYMTAWNIGSLTFEWALPLAGVMSVTMICAEFVVGILLITNAYRRLSAWLLVLMMAFFTVTTLVDAVTNKVTDCGCFGDAVKLTNWQTFWKNIALDVPTVWIFLTRNLRYRRRFERDGIILLVSIAAMVVFEMYNIKHEPVIDFRPWKVGNKMMDTDSTEGMQSYVTYRNTATGQTEEFESAQLMQRMADPEWAATWEWESSRVVDPREIAAPGFAMLDLEGEDHATDLLPAEDGLLIVTVHHLEDVDENGVRTIRAAQRTAEDNALKIVMLTAALPEEVPTWLADNNISGLDYLFADATAIETMMRGNPGLMYIKDATVISKTRRVEDLNIETK